MKINISYLFNKFKMLCVFISVFIYVHKNSLPRDNTNTYLILLKHVLQQIGVKILFWNRNLTQTFLQLGSVNNTKHF